MYSAAKCKCGSRTRVIAEVGINDSKTGKGKSISPEINIKNIHYINEVVIKRQTEKIDAFRKTKSHLAHLEEAYERWRLFCAEQDKTLEFIRISSKFHKIHKDLVRAEMSKNDPQIRKSGQCISPEITIKNIPYIDEAVKNQARKIDAFRKTESDLAYIEEAYERCRLYCVEREKMEALALRLLPKAQQRAGWAIMAWGRRIDDLVDSQEADDIRSGYVDEWELRTEDIFNGHPHDILDAAFVDTISKFHLDIEPFRDVLKGMRMDTTKKRYANFEELLLYCYYVAGTGGLMSIPIIGISPESTMSSETIYHGLVQIFIATQLTNIIQDVSEDAQIGTVYLPQDELAKFDLCDEDIFSRKVTDEWRAFMKMQIQRARSYYSNFEEIIAQLNKANRGKILSFVMAHKQILDEIEEDDYDNLTKKAAKAGYAF